MPIVFIILAVVLFIAVSAWLNHRQREKRREALAGWAVGLGLSFEPGKNSRFDDRFPEFSCFRQGKDRYAENVAFGNFEGRIVYGFDYHYETTSTSTDSEGNTSTQTHHHYFSAVIVEPELRLKPLLIRPEGMFDRVAGFFGSGDIDFESAEFSKRFHVSSEDRRWAYDVLHARAIQRLLDAPAHTIEFAPQRVLALRQKRRMEPADFDTALRLVDGLLDDLPSYVRRGQEEASA